MEYGLLTCTCRSDVLGVAWPVAGSTIDGDDIYPVALFAIP